MTERKSFKRRVRARMEKTGERYTAARRHVEPAAAEPSAEREPQPDEQPRRVSTDAVVRATGRTWDEWFALLDAWGATERRHREVAAHLREAHGVPGWWAQSLTVEYERARGVRERYEHADGFRAGASRTIAAPAARVHAAFVDEQERGRWLDEPVRLRTARAPRTARFDVGDGGTRLVVDVTARGEAKATVAVQHERLADAAAVERAKAVWRRRLDALKTLLEE